jgi:hypothetical protein
MSMVAVQAEFLLDVAELIQYASALGYTLTAGELWRPQEMQEIYVKTGRSKTLESQHGKRLAVDLNVFKDGVLLGREGIKPLGEWWEARNPKNRWGGNWRGLVEQKRSSFIDAPHFERQV